MAFVDEPKVSTRTCFLMKQGWDNAKVFDPIVFTNIANLGYVNNANSAKEPFALFLASNSRYLRTLHCFLVLRYTYHMTDEHKKILLVEDDHFLSSLLKSRLEKDGGFVVTLATNGDEALGALDETTPDLIILDIILPGRSGFEVLEEMRARPGASAPVIVMSNLGQETDVTRGKSLGAVEYFVKANTSIDDLIIKIRTMIGG